MKFYKGDIVRHQIGDQSLITIEEVNSRGWPGTHDEGFFNPDLLTLIRRANEPAWPSDVPRCELPLPEGKTRWVNRGRGFISDSRCAYWNHDQWQTTKRGSGIAGYHYAEAVNDEDYIPPQLSETTNSSQVESKVKIHRPSPEFTHDDLLTKHKATIEDGSIIVRSLDLKLKPIQAIALAELLTAAAKEAQQ